MPDAQSAWRSGPESNRHSWICSPEHHHSATGPHCPSHTGRAGEGQPKDVDFPPASSPPLRRVKPVAAPLHRTL